MTTIPGPTSHWYWSQRLRLHYADWGNPDAPPLLLIHGGRDHCRNWDWVAQELREDWHIVAPDLRGHGDSQWLVGSTYRSSDYVYDMVQLLQHTGLTPVTIIGHSLGGSIALRYAGLYPETVRKVVAIEGLGPAPDKMKERASVPVHERTRNWVDQLQNVAGRAPRRYAKLEDAWSRMQAENPHLSPEQARHLTIHGVNRNEDGTYSWKFDNYVRIDRPYGMDIEDVAALWSRIEPPTLLVRGTESWASDPNIDGRIRHFPNARAVNVEGAGHWVHHDRLPEFLNIVREFLA